MTIKPDSKLIAQDGFDGYYAEKIWEMIPAIYRHEDGVADNPGVLRALVELLGEQAAILRRSQDRLWEDQFIEWCSDWAVPYIGDLLGTRLVSLENKRGRRVDVAKTIYYRRRKGTLRILEELASDITDWEGKVVENFRRLGRTRHGLDPKPAFLAGRFSGTMPGGWADLRHQRISELAGGPFDEYHHTADIRQHRGKLGRYGIPKLAFHLYRIIAFHVEDVTPLPFGDDNSTFTFDPSGREIPLFSPRNRPNDYDWDEWHSAYEWELPAPISCRLLGQASYRISEGIIRKLEEEHQLGESESNTLRKLTGQEFKSEKRLMENLLIFSEGTSPLEERSNGNGLVFSELYPTVLANTIIEQCGKNILLKQAKSDSESKEISYNLGVDISEEENPIPIERILADNLSEWIQGKKIPYEKWLIIDPERGRFALREEDADSPNKKVSYHYGFSGRIGAGTYIRPLNEAENFEEINGGGEIKNAQINTDGQLRINDNRTYSLADDLVDNINNTIIRSADRCRPYLRLADNWILEATDNPGDSKTEPQLLLDGLWIGAAAEQEFILRGHYECVIIRHCTLDPGGCRQINSDHCENDDSNRIPPLPLVIEGTIETLIIESSITGPVFTRRTGQSSGVPAVENLIIQDSVIQSVNEEEPALHLELGKVEIKRATIFGAVNVHRLHASEALITGACKVADTQTGCFRFSAAPESSRLPRPYESHLFAAGAEQWFTSRRFGDPGYGQLNENAPAEIQRGAENRSEMGAFSAFIHPIRMDSLRAKVEEYMPFGLIPLFIYET